MATLKVNDTVRLLHYDEDDINAYGRIENVHISLISGIPWYFVSNVNQPFCGTLVYKPFLQWEVEKAS